MSMGSKTNELLSIQPKTEETLKEQTEKLCLIDNNQHKTFEMCLGKDEQLLSTQQWTPQSLKTVRNHSMGEKIVKNKKIRTQFHHKHSDKTLFQSHMKMIKTMKTQMMRTVEYLMRRNYKRTTFKSINSKDRPSVQVRRKLLQKLRICKTTQDLDTFLPSKSIKNEGRKFLGLSVNLSTTWSNYWDLLFRIAQTLCSFLIQNT